MSKPTPETWTDAKTPAQRLLRKFLNHPSPRTIRAYSADLKTLGKFLGAAGPEATARAILDLAPSRGNELGDEYIRWLRMDNASPATIWRKLYSLRSLVRCARRLGLVYWTIDARPPKPRPIRDTRGPGREKFLAMLAAAASRNDAKGVRDVALLRLLHDLALRAAEVLDLTAAHVDLPGRRVAILGKGDVERRWLDLPLETLDALAHWLAIRGPQPGPLWLTLNRSTGVRESAKALTYSGLHEVVGALARECATRCTPHGLRHTAITTALERTNGDIRGVQQFSRHQSAETVCRYDDARRDHAFEVADLVASQATYPRLVSTARKTPKRTGKG